MCTHNIYFNEEIRKNISTFGLTFLSLFYHLFFTFFIYSVYFFFFYFFFFSLLFTTNLELPKQTALNFISL